jgi:hypothetical protein
MFLAWLTTLDGVRLAYHRRDVGEWAADLVAAETILAKLRF